MKLSMAFSVSLAAGVLLLGGCTTGGGKGEPAVRLREKLEIPPDLSRSAADDLSALPTAAASGAKPATAPAATPMSLSPPAVGVTAGSHARLERDGAQRWLVVNAAPDHVWSVLRDYLKRTHGVLAAENSRHGYLETDWVEQRPNLGESALGRFVSKMQSTGLRDKFRVRVESGRAAGTSEVTVSHIGLEEVRLGFAGAGGGPETTWQPRKSDPVLEADMLDRILAALGAVDPVTHPVLADSPVKRAARPKGPLVLSGETGDSAWRRVSQALDRAGVVIEDRDRGSGLLFVRFREQAGEEKSSGLFGWLSTDRAQKKEADDGQNRYQLRLKPGTDSVIVDVLDIKGEVDKSEPAMRLLDLLFQQLF